jgi:hypothetical protein
MSDNEHREAEATDGEHNSQSRRRSGERRRFFMAAECEPFTRFSAAC